MSVHDLIGKIDWQKLAEQKEKLVELANSQLIADPYTEACDGIINLLDHIMDTGEKLGYPVVFLTEPEESETYTFEYDLSYWGGEYSGVGTIVDIEVVGAETPEAAFERVIGKQMLHIINYHVKDN